MHFYISMYGKARKNSSFYKETIRAYMTWFPRWLLQLQTPTPVKENINTDEFKRGKSTPSCSTAPRTTWTCAHPISHTHTHPDTQCQQGNHQRVETKCQGIWSSNRKINESWDQWGALPERTEFPAHNRALTFLENKRSDVSLTFTMPFYVALKEAHIKYRFQLGYLVARWTRLSWEPDIKYSWKRKDGHAHTRKCWGHMALSLQPAGRVGTDSQETAFFFFLFNHL